VTVDCALSVPAAAWPATWLGTEQSGSLVRFVETQFERERTMADVGRLFQKTKQVTVRAMPLRSIFVTLAKASRKAA
jgi:hypothetical protein